MGKDFCLSKGHAKVAGVASERCQGLVTATRVTRQTTACVAGSWPVAKLWALSYSIRLGLPELPGPLCSVLAFCSILPSPGQGESARRGNGLLVFGPSVLILEKSDSHNLALRWDRVFLCVVVSGLSMGVGQSNKAIKAVVSVVVAPHISQPLEELISDPGKSNVRAVLGLSRPHH